ncbi:DR2241 family protein [Natronomonas sp.]|uniref:DR2241 family protein n=1 Tax=Natronomonas sp. TaxID=2184060 RepID=UPI00262AB3AA|nr:DR2241 family protein [Natronomonas sp.]
MNDEQLDAFVSAAASGGLECDGVAAARDADGYRFETPDAAREGLSEAELRAAADRNPRFVSNWHYWNGRDRPDTELAFLRHLESADERSVPDRYETMTDGGIVATWGQLRIDVGLGPDGDRVYALRNEADGGVDAEALDVHSDPLEARRLVKRDDRDRYRPLKTAPTLPTGWAFVDLDGRALAETVEYVYPATIANWYLEGRGELDVSHWRETMERQSGIYGVIKTWDRGEGYEHVNWVAEACCDDSQCLKRREWEYDDETTLDVDGGDGEFPCREPCSLVVTAARKWTQLEGERTERYEFELTPSEKEQVEAIIDAVADGRTDSIREADIYEGANRYRARFLRAKRLDDEGRLCGVPTDGE